jgi:hypothetical protein
MQEALAHNNNIYNNSNLFVTTKPTALLRPAGACYKDAAQHFAAANKEFFTCTSNPSLQTGDANFRLSAQVYCDTVNNRDIINKSGEYWLVISSTFRFIVRKNGIDYTVIASNFGTVTSGAWYQVECWHDATNDILGISVNGVINTVSHTIGVDISDTQFSPGRSSYAQYFDGRIADVIFSKDEELVSYWPMDEDGIQHDKVGTNHLQPASVPLISPTINNGGFETLGTGGSDVFANWNEFTNGTSTVNSDSSQASSGSKACRLDIDASGDAAYISALNSLIIGKKYTASWYAKASTLPATMKTDSGAGIREFSLALNYQLFSADFNATGVHFTLNRGVANGKSIYIDSVTLASTGPTLIGGNTQSIISTTAPVSKILDSTFNLHHFTQPTYANRPLYDPSGINGVPCLRFDGVDDYLISGNLPAMTAGTWMVVFQADPSKTSETHLLSINPIQLFMRANSNSICCGISPNYIIANNIPSLRGIPHVAAVTFSPGYRAWYIDGQLYSTDATTMATADNVPLSIGRLYTGGYNYQGFIGDLMIITRILSTQQITSMSYALMRKYNIA